MFDLLELARMTLSKQPFDEELKARIASPEACVFH